MLKAICLIGMFGNLPGGGQVLSQPHNGLLYQQLLSSFLEKHPMAFAQVDGELLPAWMPAVKIDSSSQTHLYIGSPEIQYRKVGKSYYERSLGLSVNISDSAFISESLVYVDSISLSDLRGIRKVSPHELKGDPPTFFSKAIRPVLVVAVSVAGVVALFYLRSQ